MRKIDIEFGAPQIVGRLPEILRCAQAPVHWPVEIDLVRKEQRTPAYLAINPLGQVRVYADDRGIHIDSLAIMKYLDVRYLVPWLFQQDAEDLARVDAWIERSSAVMRDVRHYLYWQLIEPPAEGPDVAEVERLKEAGKMELEVVEQALATSGSG